MKQATTSRRILGLAAVVLVLAAIAGGVFWRLQQPEATAGGRPGGRGDKRPVPVVTATAMQQDVPVYLDALGTVQAYQTVTIRSRIDGELVDVAFKEGQTVHTGDVLAHVDSRAVQAQLAQAQAAKAKDESLLENARRDLERYVGLGNRVTGQSVDTQRALVKQLEAAVKSDQAAVDSVRVQLSYTTIVSPIDGRTGIRQIDRGNIVHAGDAAGLVVITQVQPISVVFALPQQNVQAINTEMLRGGALAVTALGADNRAVIDRGTLDLVDNQIDQTTGTVRLKATFANAGNLLWPGGFVNVRLLLTTRRGAVVVPTPAVQRGPQGAYVFVVRPDDTVEMRPLTVALTEGEVAVVDAGVQPGDTVVVDGMAKLQNGAAVVAKPAGGGAPAAAGAPGDAGGPGAAGDGGRKKGGRRGDGTGKAEGGSGRAEGGASQAPSGAGQDQGGQGGR